MLCLNRLQCQLKLEKSTHASPSGRAVSVSGHAPSMRQGMNSYISWCMSQLHISWLYKLASNSTMELLQYWNSMYSTSNIRIHTRNASCTSVHLSVENLSRKCGVCTQQCQSTTKSSQYSPTHTQESTHHIHHTHGGVLQHAYMHIHYAY